MIENVDLYIGMAVAGIFTGLGSALGNYIANKHIIESMSKIRKIVRRRRK